MNGGTVIRIVDLATKIYIDCESDQNETGVIYVERTPEAEKIRIGDAICWHGSFAYWTPIANQVSEKLELICGKDYDIRIPRRNFQTER